jgi:hypothetical protein
MPDKVNSPAQGPVTGARCPGELTTSGSATAGELPGEQTLAGVLAQRRNPTPRLSR